MKSIVLFLLFHKLSSVRPLTMNFLKNRYPFKLLTSIFRIGRKADELPGNSMDLKRNKSDSHVTATPSQESLKFKKRSTVSLAECQDIESKLTAVDSSNSLPLSKTSSEHSFRGSLNRKKTSLDFKTEAPSENAIINYKLNQLQESLNSMKPKEEENRAPLKRAYPWQNFNLNSISQESIDNPIKSPRFMLNRSSSDESMKTVSSNHSLASFKSVSSTSLHEEPLKPMKTKTQMPLFKSILKKTTRKVKPIKEVKFSDASTFYGRYLGAQGHKSLEKVIKSSAESSRAKNDEFFRNIKKGGMKISPYLGRSEPLKKENSFLSLYAQKKQKSVP